MLKYETLYYIRKGDTEREYMPTKSLHLSSGLFIPDSLLKEAGIENSEVEIMISDNQIRIVPAGMKKIMTKGIITPDSPFWKLVGSVRTPGIDGRDHDRYLYDNVE
jgi:hypothetical protein